MSMHITLASLFAAVTVTNAVSFHSIGQGVCRDGSDGVHTPWGAISDSEDAVAALCAAQESCLAYWLHPDNSYQVFCSIQEGICDRAGNGGTSVNFVWTHDNFDNDCMVKSDATTASPTTASPTSSARDCDDFNIDGFLNECSAEFPAEKEALEAVDARVTQLTSDLSTLESETATSADLDATDIAVDDLSSRLEVIEADIPVEKEAFNSLETRVTQLSGDLSARLDSIELTLLGFSSARMAPAQFDSVPSSTSVSSLILGDKDVLIFASLAFSAVLLTALLVVQCRTGNGYKSVRTFAESEAELVQ